MRLPTISLLCAVLSSIVIAESAEQPLGVPSVPELKGETLDEDAPKGTIFNGIDVPALPDIDGEKFDATVKTGYWFVKHHSPYCPHCLHIAPAWQTLHEFYWTSKPVPSGTSGDLATTSMNTFQAYYDFHFGSLNCIAFGNACTAHKVDSFPTFILYHDGVEVKRFDGVKDIKGLSDFIEGVLESIKPGSRTVGGPALPTPGAKVSPDAPTKAADDIKLKPAAEAITLSTSKAAFESTGKLDAVIPPTGAEKEAVVKTPLVVTPINTQPKKPAGTPNPVGTSISLTAETFQRQVTQTQHPWFIKFYAPWCGHCQAMAPNWIQLGKEMKGKLNIGEVNCEVETRLCKDVHLRGYPTILFFRGGERVEYDGLRGLGDFVEYAKKAIDTGEGVRDVDAGEFKELEEKEEVIFLYFYDHATTSEDFAALERLTLSLIGHAKLVKTNSALLAERFKITTWPRLIVSRDGRPTYYTALSPAEMRDFRRVLNWMQSVWLPIVPELTASNSREIMDGKLVVLGILTRERTDEFLMAKKEIKSAAIEWMDKEIATFQRERQDLRDSKQLRLEEAEDRNDQRALRAAKQIRINMERSDHKEVGFAWVDGVFWERWIRTTYGIEVAKDGEKVIINDEDNRRYWDTTVSGNFIMASRTSILETIKNVADKNPTIKPKSTISSFEKFFFDIRHSFSNHPFLSIGVLIGVGLGAYYVMKKRRRGRGGFFRLDDRDGLLGSGGGGKVD